MSKDIRTRTTPAEWRAIQQSGKDVPSEVVWPKEICSRCRRHGPMQFTTGNPLCEDCTANTVIQLASPLGLHERREVPQLEKKSSSRKRVRA